MPCRGLSLLFRGNEEPVECDQDHNQDGEYSDDPLHSSLELYEPKLVGLRENNPTLEPSQGLTLVPQAYTTRPSASSWLYTR